MQSGKKALLVLGILLIVIQILSIIGVSRMRVGLYPDGYDLLYPSYSSERLELTPKMVSLAIEAGADRFKSSFEDLTYEKDEYRIMSATQMLSAMVRDSLGGNKGGTFGLFIYDVILTVSYCFTGLLGVGLLAVMPIKSKLKEHKQWKEYQKKIRELEQTENNKAETER